MATRSSLKKVEKKVSLNIKVSSRLNLKLQFAREQARKQGSIYNVSQEVEKFLSKNVDKVLGELGYPQDVDLSEG